MLPETTVGGGREQMPGTDLKKETTDREAPLCVDLDGTLVNTDLLLETGISAIKTSWKNIFRLPAWVLSGKATVKSGLAITSFVDPRTLPYNQKLLEYLRGERERGREIILATASDRRIAEEIAHHLGLFDDVMASDGITNLKGEAKAVALVDRYGERGFSYAGNDRSDLPVWRRSKSAVLANTKRSVSRAVADMVPIEQVFDDRASIFYELVREARPLQWLKNILVFIAPIAGHMILDPTVFFHTFVTFLAFCAAASAIYFFNDLLDLEADRRHPRKRRRPFASGRLPLPFGLAGPVLIFFAMAIGSIVSLEIVLIVSAYIVLSLLYSNYFKTKPLADVFCLALLYTIRLVAGGIASTSGVSIWLLNFSGFLFLSLGLLKRYAEYFDQSSGESGFKSSRRGYTENDSLLIIIMGVGSSFISALVFGLYVSSAEVKLAYRNPSLMWGAVPLILFWQCRLWLATVRGYMHDDPIIYAATDKISYIVMSFVFLIYLLATIDLGVLTMMRKW